MTLNPNLQSNIGLLLRGHLLISGCLLFFMLAPLPAVSEKRQTTQQSPIEQSPINQLRMEHLSTEQPFIEQVEMPAAEIAALRKALSSAPITAGNFTQTRHISGIPKALQSEGRFIFWLNRGIFWQTDHPFFSAVTFTTEDVIQWDSRFAAVPDNGRQNIVQRYMNDVILAIFQADSDSLKRYFYPRWRGSKAAWTLRLLPSTAAVSKAVEHIELGGDDFIRTVRIISAQGDETEVVFSNLHSRNQFNQRDCRYFHRDPEQSCQNDPPSP